MVKKREKIPPDYLKAFTQRIVEARRFARLNQAEVASQLGVPLDSYKKYEGRSLMPHHLIARFSEITGQTVHVLMGGGIARRPSHLKTDRARELLEVFERMSPDNQEFALQQVKLVRTLAPGSPEQREALADAMSGRLSKTRR